MSKQLTYSNYLVSDLKVEEGLREMGYWMLKHIPIKINVKAYTRGPKLKATRPLTQKQLDTYEEYVYGRAMKKYNDTGAASVLSKRAVAEEQKIQIIKLIGKIFKKE